MRSYVVNFVFPLIINNKNLLDFSIAVKLLKPVPERLKLKWSTPS